MIFLEIEMTICNTRYHIKTENDYQVYMYYEYYYQIIEL